jgi:DNA-binding CsgD family transcriptional regulator
MLRQFQDKPSVIHTDGQGERLRAGDRSAAGRAAAFTPNDAPRGLLGSVTPHRAEILAMVDDQRTFPRAARRLQVSPETVRSQIREVRDAAGAEDTVELLRLWRRHRGAWLRQIAIRARIPFSELEPWTLADLG